LGVFLFFFFSTSPGAGRFFLAAGLSGLSWGHFFVRLRRFPFLEVVYAVFFRRRAGVFPWHKSASFLRRPPPPPPPPPPPLFAEEGVPVPYLFRGRSSPLESALAFSSFRIFLTFSSARKDLNCIPFSLGQGLFPGPQTASLPPRKTGSSKKR